MSNQFLELNTNAIRVNGLQFEDEKGVLNFDNVATVQVTLKKDGINVLPDVWPLNVPYIATTNGIYYASFDAALQIVDGDVVETTVESSSVNAIGNWREDVRVYTRPLDGSP